MTYIALQNHISTEEACKRWRDNMKKIGYENIFCKQIVSKMKKNKEHAALHSLLTMTLLQNFHINGSRVIQTAHLQLK